MTTSSTHRSALTSQFDYHFSLLRRAAWAGDPSWFSIWQGALAVLPFVARHQSWKLFTESLLSLPAWLKTNPETITHDDFVAHWRETLAKTFDATNIIPNGALLYVEQSPVRSPTQPRTPNSETSFGEEREPAEPWRIDERLQSFFQSEPDLIGLLPDQFAVLLSLPLFNTHDFFEAYVADAAWAQCTTPAKFDELAFGETRRLQRSGRISTLRFFAPADATIEFAKEDSPSVLLPAELQPGLALLDIFASGQVGEAVLVSQTAISRDSELKARSTIQNHIQVRLRR